MFPLTVGPLKVPDMCQRRLETVLYSQRSLSQAVLRLGTDSLWLKECSKQSGIRTRIKEPVIITRIKSSLNLLIFLVCFFVLFRVDFTHLVLSLLAVVPAMF